VWTDLGDGWWESRPRTIGTGYAIAVTNGQPFAGDQCGIWVDWNRDGDWADTVTCPGGGPPAPEWAVQDQVLALAQGMHVLLSPPFVSSAVIGEGVPFETWMRLSIADGLPPIRGDAARLETALLDLALNARDAMPDGGELAVEVDRVELDAAHAAVHAEATAGDSVTVAWTVTNRGPSGLSGSWHDALVFTPVRHPMRFQSGPGEVGRWTRAADGWHCARPGGRRDVEARCPAERRSSPPSDRFSVD
jgi:hypothetical protein